MQPQFQCTTLHSLKVFNKLQSLKHNVQHIALKKVKSIKVKKTKQNIGMHNSQLVHVAQLSPMFFVAWGKLWGWSVQGPKSKPQ